MNYNPFLFHSQANLRPNYALNTKLNKNDNEIDDDDNDENNKHYGFNAHWYNGD